ncbi:MAG: glutamyl-Q tRNA(Asp) synthetase [Glaciecola sp.]|jgi:glutamyl-Q tRNA(Asp) synthetase
MQSYIGRFAPSPSGPLHFGSLICALVSFLHARQANGAWLVRIEDVDTTRVKAGADQTILSQLQAHGMQWDGETLYQTARNKAYQHALDTLREKQLVYACSCTRQEIKSKGKYYTGTCRDRGLPFEGNAIRLINNCTDSSFIDLHLGTVEVDPSFCSEDICIKRKDGLFAYNLAVVLDDIAQKVSHIVRGADLIDTTIQQQQIYRLLGEKAPKYFHLPAICIEHGRKLSKQNHAAPIQNNQASVNLICAFKIIGLSTDTLDENMPVDGLIQWAIENWSPNLLAKRREILFSGINTV